MSSSSPPGAPSTPETSEDSVSPSQAVGRAARMLHPQIGSLPTGDQAALRRVSTDRPVTPALWKVLLALRQGDSPGGVGQHIWERRWALLLMGMAHCAGLHDYDMPLGEALATAGWSETRFVRLMEAGPDALPNLVRRMAQYLASKRQAANWDDVRRLLFYHHGETAEEIRLDIARTYYRTLYAQEEEA